MPDLGKENKESAVKRLEELGVAQVKSLMSCGGLPAEWHSIIHQWLSDKEKPEFGKTQGA